MIDGALPLYSGALIVSMGLSLGLAVMAFHRIKVPGAQAFLFGNLAAFFYSLGSLLEITSATPEQALASLTLEYVGIATLGPLLFLTSISATRGAWAVSLLPSVMLFIIPGITILAVATNSLHHLFYSSLTLTRRGPFTVPVLGRGPFYMINLVYMNVCLLWGTLIPLRQAWNAPRALRNPLRLLVGASLFPWSGMAIYLLGWSPWGLDVAPFGLTVSGIVFAVALFRFRLFDLTPMVTDQVFENMKEGVLVVDQKDRLIGVNPALTGILPRVTRNRIGDSLESLGLPDLRSGADLRLSEGTRSGNFQVDRSPLWDKKGRLQGEIFMFTDVTQREELAEKLSRLARTDELTGLPNRRFFLERMEEALARHRRYGAPFALAIADIDHFKRVNDTWGHEAGDAALIHVSTLWSSGLRDSDLLARYGGEEFTFLLPQSSASEALVLLERTRSRLEDCPLVWNGSPIPMTASFGLAVAGAETVEQVLRRADAALYWVKEHGRNQVKILDTQETP